MQLHYSTLLSGVWLLSLAKFLQYIFLLLLPLSFYTQGEWGGGGPKERWRQSDKARRINQVQADKDVETANRKDRKMSPSHRPVGGLAANPDCAIAAVFRYTQACSEVIQPAYSVSAFISLMQHTHRRVLIFYLYTHGKDLITCLGKSRTVEIFQDDGTNKQTNKRYIICRKQWISHDNGRMISTTMSS